jgi:outer membrane protein assembly factor BamD (BamD/ComL family)
MKYLAASMLVFFIVFCSQKLTEEEYYSKAQENYANQKFELAVENFKGIAEYYENGKHHAEALFMLGFINANDLKDLDEAKKYYTAFIEKYPQHELADDAQYELDNLGKDINELPIFQDSTTDSTNASPSI